MTQQSVDVERFRVPPEGPSLAGAHDPAREVAAATAARISVVIPCYNQAHFLAEAIESVLAQEGAEAEIVVVDDGSTDSSAEVAARYPEVRYVRQHNQGLSAARNTGLQHSSGEYLVFLDADDRLLPDALAHGRRFLDAHPGRAFVSGHFRLIAEDGSILEEPEQITLRGSGHHQLLRGNYIGMHATVLYRRSALETVGGFDTTLRACEDYDMYFRISKVFPVAQHRHLTAEYRRHGTNMSRDLGWMLDTVLRVRRRYRPDGRSDPEARAEFREGEWAFRTYYVEKALERTRLHLARGERRAAVTSLVEFVRAGGVGVLPVIASSPRLTRKLARMRLGRVWLGLQRRLLRRPGAPTWVRKPGVGRVRFGHLRRVTPIDATFGYGRGLPVDRYYIERFLAQNSLDVRGRVLEIGDDTYTRRFGEDRVVVADVLHVDDTNPHATIVADLANAEHLPAATFDCVILTQTLQLVYDVKAALRTVHRILRPGGVLLLTVPGISQISDPTWRGSWYWSFTPLSTMRLLEECFPAASISTATHGNVLAASAFLYGLATEELRREELDAHDPNYPMLITARVAKPDVDG